MNIYTTNQVKEVANAFLNHEIIAFPTDTVYGVGVLYGDVEDLDRLKHAKHRPETKPIPMMVSSVDQMKKIAYVDARTEKIVDKFLPGALTLILPVLSDVNPAFTNGQPTVAVRIPDEEFILKVMDQIGSALLVTSANQSGQKTALSFEDAFRELPNIDGIVKGSCKALQASTIVDCTGETLKILREGPITLKELEIAIRLY